MIRDEEEAWDVAAETVAVGHLEVGLGHVLSPHTVGALARGFISNLAGEPAVEALQQGQGRIKATLGECHSGSGLPLSGSSP